MCGIAGLIGCSSADSDLRINRMLQAIAHRGPDDRGVYADPDQSVWLGHQRLAILDLSPLGHQPMVSRCGRYSLVFNGEIYNFRSLREGLLRDGVELTSQSDTEVILHLFQRRGPECLSDLDGMFAFAIWDTQARKLFCARDPLGIKPLYYWQVGQQLAFASEVRGLLAADLGPRKLNRQAVEGYLLFGSVQEPETLVEGLQSLPAGHYLTWSKGQLDTREYWKLSFARSVSTSSSSRSYAEWTSSVRQALDDSIARHFVSDVPVGIFLSGGIDSTAVVALAHAQKVSELQTFCISFDQPEFDEGQIAQRTAEHFGTQHHQWKMNAAEGKRLFADFLKSFDLPSNDGFNTYCVSRFARDHGLKVVLSGLGGDELFGGYPSFDLIPKLLRFHRRCALCGGPWVAKALSSLPLPLRHRRLLSFLQSNGGPEAAYWAIRGFFLPSELPAVFRGLGVSYDSDFEFSSQAIEQSLLDNVAYLETTRYMRNQLLRDSDVMSMAVSLELRTPLVDRKLLDSLAVIPASLRLQTGKKLLTDAVPEIPPWILQQPKRGFRFPFEDWISGHWNDMFVSIENRMPLKLHTWSRKWILLLLQEFIQRHSIGLT